MEKKITSKKTPYRRTLSPISNLNKTLSKLLCKLRINHNDSQLKASEKLNLSRGFISELEGGSRRVTLSVLEKYSKAYDIDIFMLIFLAEKKWRVVNSSKFTSYEKLQKEHFDLYKEQNREYLISEFQKLIE